jgi:hypothetical protein
MYARATRGAGFFWRGHVSRLYGEQHRALQDEFDRRRMADRIESVATEEQWIGRIIAGDDNV